MNDELFVLDSNILIYAFDTSEKRKHKIAAQLLSEVLENTSSAICLQNLTEFFAVSTRNIKSPIPKETAKEIVQLFIASKHIQKLKLDENSILRALELPLPFRDSLIVSTMIENKIFRIYTENVKDFKDHRIKAINPFKNPKGS